MEYKRICKGCEKEFTTTNHRIWYCQKPHPYTCENCGKEFTTDGPRKKTCSRKCQNEQTQKKRKETFKDPKVKAAFLEKMRDPEKIKKQRESYLKTVKERYGDDITNTSQLKSVQDKMKKTNKKKYGVDFPLQSTKIQEKIKASNLEKYGVENPGGLKETQKKIRATNMERYGVEWNTQMESMRQKNRELRLLKPMNHVEDWNDFENFVDKNPDMNPYEMSIYFNIRYQSLRNHILKHNLEYKVHKFFKYSKAELIIVDFFDKLGLEQGVDYIPHDRKVITPYEIDILLPNHNLGIEVSPTFFHNDDYLKNKRYHLNKYEQAKEKGIELITIFDWHDFIKIQNLIQNKLNLTNTTRIGARNCSVIQYTQFTKELHEFIQKNHVLGDVKFKNVSSLVSLMVDDKLVGLSVFTKTDKENIVELKRLCFDSNTSIAGGASKMLMSFLKTHSNINKIITYSDNDLGWGNVYEKLGFSRIEEGRPQLNWYNPKEDFLVRNLSLVKQGADRLLRNFNGYEDNGDLTNIEIMRKYGFQPIYDCGYTKWEYNKKASR